MHISRIRRTCLFHIAHYPVRRFLRDIPTFLKCPLHSLVGEGLVATGNRAIVHTKRNQPPPLFTFSLARVEVLLDCSRFQLLLFAYFAYISYFSSFLFHPEVILVLCDHRVRIFTACVVDEFRFNAFWILAAPSC